MSINTYNNEWGIGMIPNEWVLSSNVLAYSHLNLVISSFQSNICRVAVTQCYNVIKELKHRASLSEK